MVVETTPLANADEATVRPSTVIRVVFQISISHRLDSIFSSNALI